MNKSLANSHATPKRMLPFLKWAGGKRWLIEQHADLIPQKFGRYFEPFLGSGSIFFHLAPRAATLSDTNHELIECYEQIKLYPKQIRGLMEVHHRCHSEEHYYSVRAKAYSDPIERAAKFLYLNRTCFNGIYRVNLKGTFNVPMGTKTNVVLGTDDFEAIASLLSTVTLLKADFETAVAGSARGDLIYFDPPYTVNHNNNGFLKYNEKIFSWSDQVRLRDAVESAASRGVTVMVSNAAHDSVIKLYDGIGETHLLSRASVLSGNASGRGRYDEILVVVNG